MNLFLILSVPLGLIFLRYYYFSSIPKRDIMGAFLGGLLTELFLFMVYWPYSSGFRLPWNPIGLGLYEFFMSDILMIGPLFLSYWLFGRKFQNGENATFIFTLWLGGGLTLLGLRDFMLTAPATQDITLFFQPLVRLMLLTVLPKLFTGLNRDNLVVNLSGLILVPLITAYLSVLNYYQWGWISYVILVCLIGGTLWYMDKELRRARS